MIASLTKRLVGEGTRQDMEYEEELVHNVPAIAWSAIISVAKKAEDIVLCMMTTLVIMLQPTVLQNQVANLPHILLKMPNTLVIK